jgi:dUTP pyrophosphatase
MESSNKKSESLPLHQVNVFEYNDNHWKNLLTVERMDKQLAKVPTTGTKDSVGYDLYPFEPSGMIPSRGQKLIGTKIKIGIPPGYYGRIAARSGLSVNHCLDIGAGIIDPDYQGEIMILVRNHSDIPYCYTRDKAIAQLIISPYAKPDIKEIRSIEEVLGVTERGIKGFGSTDV